MSTTEMPKLKLRVGRVIAVILLILFGYWLITWVKGNTQTLHTIDAKISTLSSQLDEQKQKITNLNRSLIKFSAQLNSLNTKLDGVYKQARTNDQTNSHAIQEIMNDVRSMKNKLDVLEYTNSNSGRRSFR